jgi:hypothetical protein
MQRGTHYERSSDPRQRAPPVVVSLGITIAFVAVVTLALAAMTAPVLIVAFLTAVVTSVAGHAVRARIATRWGSERRAGEANGQPA